ncbi:hypothetical protein GCK32_010923 [Trichostrongylus colubriformis]|uniref:Uncharacterized protein n=1 Tax=Trichostrongylus colubriformis TaxID=6319 RepID=A0AAN8ENK5_TRICO
MLLLLSIGIIAAICSASSPPEGVVGLEIPIPIFRVYDAHSRNHWIPNAVFNIRRALKAGLGVEVYMVPKTHRFKEDQGSAQIREAFNGFNSANLGVSRIWIKVKSQSFDQDREYNRGFLKEMISSARNLGIDVGFFTNRKNWNEITNEWNLDGHHLW